ncbi:MAG: hypothetical protein AUG06_02910 [Actinobacteria bacterium 13_1_20CM_2_65_11]|nr:MAG: hypothetical protein AUH40_11725 [Chloroflexi bacterium 13_1_40CM_65_17]OLC66372.1 MAG: hypothetical protein AUH69_07065 [Actinobacteria bacterium 13_1_40CM_4_65_12]OLD24338.1 MAG: hypothetical protein AUJ02_08195 [Chloroflexi bacterium 13_1_40CM_3_65_12]OLD50264.1 MAG: hypothetical protein AUI42_04120 [Actinobacteria bacterium 13_1_40CM_2_65_8]OLE80910.1 MAG: hypothetical protein AUG06_02910 [Actinobacteria bacterium 13_1_20CM_2_65_11]
MIARLYRFHFKSERRERLFLASLAFLLTFAGVRAMTFTIHIGIGPFQNVTAGGLHIHHLVWGILLLLVVGYLWLIQVGTGQSQHAGWFSRITAIAYGVGAALALDEFALWLNLKDVYWERAGRQSVDAVFIFASLLSVGVWGGPFLHGVVKEILALSRRPKT